MYPYLPRILVDVSVATIFNVLFNNTQIEWLTAGECMAGMHEVVVTNRTTDAIKRALEQNCCLWRVSSTVREEIRLKSVFF